MFGLIAIVGALLLFGAWGIFHKLAVDRAHPFTVEWMAAVPVVLLLPVWFVLGNRLAPATNFEPKAFLPAAAAGASGVIATILVLFAMRERPASVVIAVTAGYPMVTLLFALATKTEAFSAVRAGGVVLITVGVVLLLLSE